MSQLRPALGHPGKESELAALDHQERERHKQALQLLTAHAAAEQVGRTQHTAHTVSIRGHCSIHCACGAHYSTLCATLLSGSVGEDWASSSLLFPLLSPSIPPSIPPPSILPSPPTPQEVEELHARHFTEKILQSVSELVSTLDEVTLHTDIIPPCESLCVACGVGL